ncbi:MAG: family 1 glycosylhydrolase, partial [Pseudomonadales bacterium]
RQGDLEAIKTPVDFQGLNQYFPSYIQAAEGQAWPFKHAEPPKYFRRTEMGWAIDGDCFYKTMKILQEKYGNPPVFVTENGGAFVDIPGSDGRVDDQDRIAYYTEYLGALLRGFPKVLMFWAICHGRFSTISNGHMFMTNGSGWCMSIMTPRNAPQRRPMTLCAT